MTERILARLPGPRAPWIAAWALVPWVNAAGNLALEPEDRSVVWDQSDALVLLSYTAFSSAIVITVWGAARIARELEKLSVTTSQVLDGSVDAFRGVNSVVGPVLASVATALAFGVSGYVAGGWVQALVRGVPWLVLGLALWSFLWTYGSVLLGLDRLGRERLRPDVSRVDPTLGLRPLGAVAFMGLWMLLAWLGPLVVTSLPDVPGIVIGLLVLSTALATFFLSLYRLHGQMVEVKRAEIEMARDLYGQAYEPVRTARTLAALDQQQRLLGAADALEKRALAIHEWPVSEGTVARVVTITTSVMAIAAARLLLGPLGL